MSRSIAPKNETHQSPNLNHKSQKYGKHRYHKEMFAKSRFEQKKESADEIAEDLNSNSYSTFADTS